MENIVIRIETTTNNNDCLVKITRVLEEIERKKFSFYPRFQLTNDLSRHKVSGVGGGGRVVRRCWENFQCWGVLLIWISVGQGLIALAVGVGGGCLDIFSLICHFSFLSPGPI